MPRYNLWFGMSDDFQAELKALVRDDTPATEFPLINNLGEDTKEFLNNVYDGETVSRLFKTWDANSRNYRVWSVYANKIEGFQSVKDDLDAMNAAYPQDYMIMGAWRYEDGDEVGPAGSEMYPIPNQTINFMPDVLVDNTDPENPIYEPATELTDVNLLFGQAPRSFGSYTG